MSDHKHRAIPGRTETVGFSAPVAQPENPSAHGNICDVDVCSCGAERRTNINQSHRERGTWTAAASKAVKA